MTNIEKLANEIIAEFEKDGEEISMSDALEMAEMEIKAKGIKTYISSEKKKKSKRIVEHKVDFDKKELLDLISSSLEGKIENLEWKNEAQIHFDFKGKSYTIMLTKHRSKAKK